MPWREEYDKPVVQWLEQHQVHCPVCDGIRFEWERAFLHVSRQTNAQLTVEQHSVDSFVGFTCDGCGYFFMIDSRKTGIPPREARAAAAASQQASQTQSSQSGNGQ